MSRWLSYSTVVRCSAALVAAVSLVPAIASAQHADTAAVEADLKRFTLADGLKLELFAAEPMLANPVAFSIDGKGRIFVAESHRWATSIFDITAHTDWLLHDLSFRSVADREAFLVNQFTNDPTLLTRDSEQVRLVEDRDGDLRADHSEVFATGFNSPADGTAAGVLAQGTNVWFANIPNLWRLDGAGKKSLASGFGVHIGVSGHDLHGLIKGPDGRIYMSFGDRGVCITNREGRVINVPDTGGVLRCEPDGRKLEIFCTGLRNPQELAFDDLGNLWTVDNDTAGPDPCRVLHLVEGGDYGWRCSYQHMKNFGPWVSEELWKGDKDGILPPAGTVSQGPAGLAFYPGTGFGERFANTFLHADFPGGIWAFTVKPQGASYVIDRKEKILWNAWPTDVDFGPDGDLYVLDWVSGWGAPGKGRIYRLTGSAELGVPNAELVAQTRKLLAEGMSGRNEKELLELLGHPNRNVRLEAQWALAGRGRDSFEGLRDVAFSQQRKLARLHAIWAIGQIARPIHPNVGGDDFSDELFSLIPLMDDADPDVRLRTAELMADTALGNANPVLLAMLNDPDPRVQMQAMISQGKTVAQSGGRRALSPAEKAKKWLSDRLPKVGREVSRFVDLELEWTFDPGGKVVIELVRTNQSVDPFFAWAAASYFKDLEIGESGWPSYRGVSVWPTVAAINQPTAVSRAWVHALRCLTNPAVAIFATNSNSSVVLEAARVINDVPIADAYPALANLLGREDFEREMQGAPASPRSTGEQILRRALNAHYRLGGVTNAEALVAYAQRASAPATLRAEALFLLGQWEVKSFVTDAPKIARVEGHGSSPVINPENYPQWFNRVNGLWQPLDVRSAEPARLALVPAANEPLADSSDEVRIAAIESAAELRLPGVETILFSLARDSEATVPVRVEAVNALGKLEAPKLGDAVKTALADDSSKLRIAGLNWLEHVDADPLIPELEKLLQGEGESSAKQAALRALGRTGSTRGGDVLAREFDRLLAGDYPAELRLDVVEAGQSSSSSTVRERLARYQAALPKDDPLTPFRETLAGGDAARGKSLFFNHPGAQCVRCHKINGEGGIVGPDLTGIGRRQTREYLLESIVTPNSAIAAGFENVTVLLKNGTSHAGVVVREDDQTLTLNAGEDGELTLMKGVITSRARGLSAMPEGLNALLSKQEIRDLIAYLAALR